MSPRRGDWRREPITQLDQGVTQQISELGRSVATMKQHFEEEWTRKENCIRRKQEKEEEKRREEEMRIREAEERAIQVKKARKKERRRREAESRAKLKKDLSMQMVMQLSELEDKNTWPDLWAGAHVHAHARARSQLIDEVESQARRRPNLSRRPATGSASVVCGRRFRGGVQRCRWCPPPPFARAIATAAQLRLRFVQPAAPLCCALAERSTPA
ncbi:hypothetical protein CBR_g50253 [Chara braunii]|uniref:Uncharacterized protein n=1 Tax=Chara braunii TaxID=69332 RepID=A0A388M6P6_CHABU|nr:hypothetical protein CBR_g50253 [Chara braunii]|eukprot:GBG90159.1 hypothetical protein CBR_g50253 [Chara braunii]